MRAHSAEEIWGEHYVEHIEKADAQGEVPGAAVYREYLEALGISPCHAVLDLGVGTGRLLPDLLSRGGFVCGMDLSMTMMRRAQERLGDRAVLVQGDAQQLPFADASFDRIVAWAVWENIPDQRRALAEAARLLRPDGRLLFTTKNLTSWHSLRLAWRRVKQAWVREFWRRACRHPGLVRLVPRALAAKCERVVERREVPQYPTLWPALRATARRLGLELALLDKYSDTMLVGEARLPAGAWRHRQFVVVFEKRV